jgi:hypothetical protein
VARPQRSLKFAAIKMQQDSVSQNRVNGTAEFPAPNVENSG